MKRLSALGLLWISLTSMIGSGWLFGSLYSAHFAGPAAILAWPIGGILLLFVGLTFAELATMFPYSNSLTLPPLYTHGRFTGVIMSGLTWLSLVTIPVIETQGLIQYASNYLPHVMMKENNHYIITSRGYFLAVILLFSLVYLNYFGIKLFAKINAGFTIWKLLIPAITIIALLNTSYHAHNLVQFGGFMPYGWQGMMMAMSNGGVLFSLLGFRQVVVMTNEIDNPGKHVPLILISSIILVTLLYTALQWTFIVSLRSQDLMHGWAQLAFPGDAGPFAALAFLAGMVWLSSLLYTDAFISPYSTSLVYATTAACMLASMGTDGDSPKQLALLNRYQAPWVSLLINFFLGACMFFFLHGWVQMASFLVCITLVGYATGPICLPCLRKQMPAHNRPFRLKCSMLVSFIGFYVCTAGVYWAGFYSLRFLIVLTYLFAFIYLIYNILRKNSLHSLDVKNGIWVLVYLIALGVFSFLGNYGGHHYLPQYWDMLYLLGLSLIIFVLAYLSRLTKQGQKNHVR